MGEGLKKAGCIVVSGINFFEGGPLTLMKDCIKYLDESDVVENYSVLILVSNTAYYKDLILKRVRLIEFPLARKSYMVRLFYEYIYFRKFALKNDVTFWLSLHDVTPRLNNKTLQAVYCHNPAPFYKVSFHEFIIEPMFGFFSWFYQYLYRINIRSNHYVIVQQQWIREKFSKLFDLDKAKIIVAHPGIGRKVDPEYQTQNRKKMFFYPTLSRVFKNIELIGEATKKLNEKGITSFEVIVTVDGTENRYSKWIKKKYGTLFNLKLIGKQPLEKVFKLYSEADYLLFPSKLETWGLPITEFKQTNKPILMADLPYAHETLGDYHAACFFDPLSSEDLATKMEKAINEKDNVFSPHSFHNKVNEPLTNDWSELFELLLNGKGTAFNSNLKEEIL